MGQSLYPHELSLTTPYGVADFARHQPPPTALRAARVRAPNNRIALNGSTILSFPQHAQGWQLTLALSDRNPLHLDQALILQRCMPGDLVSITENLTRRDTRRIWTGARVIEPDSGTWVAGNPRDGDFFTVVMTFFVPD